MNAVLPDLDARVLRALDPLNPRRVDEVARRADTTPELTLASLKRLRGQMLVEDDLAAHALTRRGWLRTRQGDVALEHTP